MTAFEKAIDMIVKMMETIPDSVIQDDTTAIRIAKMHALIAVQSIKEAIDWHEFETPNKELKFWAEVESEIEKL